MTPEPGYWLGRLVKGGPLVPMMIAGPLTHEPGEPGNPLDRSPLALPFIAAIAGDDADPLEVWERARLANSPGGRPISKAEYEFRVAELRWAQQFAAADPRAMPRRRIDHLAAPVPF